ncbi:MAG TPA: NUDIX hydrolase [Phototrophicaceae bacterium]|nr:NUDIX hydrolase [Phototrophicaceae bacterium]
MVAANALVFNPHGEILLNNNPKRGWENPGGKVLEGETVIACLDRILLQQAGITAEIGTLTGIYSNTQAPTRLFLSFLATWTSGDLISTVETGETRWVPQDQAIAMIGHPAIVDRIRDMLYFREAHQIIYRVYTTDPYVPISIRTI